MPRPKGSTNKEKMKSTPIAIRFPDPVLDRLKEISEQEGWTINVTVREAVKEFINRRDNR